MNYADFQIGQPVTVEIFYGDGRVFSAQGRASQFNHYPSHPEDDTVRVWFDSGPFAPSATFPASCCKVDVAPLVEPISIRPTRINLEGTPLPVEAAAELQQLIAEKGRPIKTQVDVLGFIFDMRRARQAWLKRQSQ